MTKKFPLIECVPNFSEGRDKNVIDAIVKSIKLVHGVKVLHVDMGFDAHRTVVTFVGAPDKVCEAAYQAIKTASELIDMRHHKGIHPRIGAIDVCPLVPIRDITLEETAEYARQLGQRVGDNLHIPVYLYEAAATANYRKNLADIRKPQYEGLERMLTDPKWLPDFYSHYNSRSGATVIGARPFLIAFNVNLNTTDVSIAKKLAAMVREKPSKENPSGGLLTVKAIGWFVKEYNCAQVSMNLVDYNVTPPSLVYKVLKKLAPKVGTKVTGSELIGLIPQEPLLTAALMQNKEKKQSIFKFVVLTNLEKLNWGVEYLGLNALGKFDVKKRVIEYLL